MPGCESNPNCIVSGDYYECDNPSNLNVKNICMSAHCVQKLQQTGGGKYTNDETGWANATADILNFYKKYVKSGSSYCSIEGLKVLSDETLTFKWVTYTYVPTTAELAFDDIYEKVKIDATNDQTKWTCVEYDSAGRCTLAERFLGTGLYKPKRIFVSRCACPNASYYIGYDVICEEVYQKVTTRSQPGNRDFYIESFAKYSADALNQEDTFWSLVRDEHEVPLSKYIKFGSCDAYQTLDGDGDKIIGVRKVI